MSRQAGRSWTNGWPAFLVLGLAAMVAQALPVLLLVAQTHSRVRFLGWTYEPPYTVFEIFGFTGFLFTLLALWIGRRRLGPGPASTMRLAAFALVAIGTLLIITECTQRSYDYQRYEQAAQAYLSGGQAYGTGYLYPPTLATALALVYRTLDALPYPAETRWYMVFYGWQTLQFFLVLAAFVLTLRVVRRRLPPKGSLADTALVLAVVTALFLVNNALLRTLRFNQVNLLVLDAVLIAILTVDKVPWLAALALAVGIHLKIYPALFLLPIALARRWSVLGLVVVFGVALYAVQVYGLGNAAMWKEYLAYAPHASIRVYIRDTSAYAILTNTLALVTSRADTIAAVRSVGTVLWNIGFGAWFVLRQWRAGWRRGGKPGSARAALPAMVDTLPFLVLLSPIVWEHHWIFMLPFALVCFLSRMLTNPKTKTVLPAAACVAFIYWLPTFDLWPASYLRLVGLIGLLVLTERRGV